MKVFELEHIYVKDISVNTNVKGLTKREHRVKGNFINSNKHNINKGKKDLAEMFRRDSG